MTAKLQVLQAGPHVTVQDAGRPGLMRYGVPTSGPMDRKALAIANTALGNPLGAPGIEVSPGGLTLACRVGPVSLAIAGGGFIVNLNDRRLGSWNVLTLQTDDLLVIRPGHWGNWCCIAASGKIQCRTWLKSSSTHAPSGLGGGHLAAGQDISIANPRHVVEGRIPCPVWARPRHRINVVFGPQDHLFDAETVQRFVSSPFSPGTDFDRMGMRLLGPDLMPRNALGIPSQPVTRGAVQVAGDGVATVLMADHQTTGGYPKIATVLDDDTDGLAQVRPGEAIVFSAISAARAIQLSRLRRAAFQQWLAALSARQKGGP